MKQWKNTILSLASFLLAFGFWGLIFPEYTFTTDTVTILSEDGTKLSDEDFSNFQDFHHIYYEIGTSDNVQIKSKAFEWIGEIIHDR